MSICLSYLLSTCSQSLHGRVPLWMLKQQHSPKSGFALISKIVGQSWTESNAARIIRTSHFTIALHLTRPPLNCRSSLAGSPGDADNVDWIASLNDAGFSQISRFDVRLTCWNSEKNYSKIFANFQFKPWGCLGSTDVIRTTWTAGFSLTARSLNFNAVLEVLVLCRSLEVSCSQKVTKSYRSLRMNVHLKGMFFWMRCASDVLARRNCGAAFRVCEFLEASCKANRIITLNVNKSKI